MNKEIDLQKIEDPLSNYLFDIPVPLEEYTNILTKYELLRLDKNFTPFHITKGCLSKKRITKLLDLLIKKNKSIKSLNLSGCIINFSDFKKLENFKNLRSLNLHQTIEFGKIFRNVNFTKYNMLQIEKIIYLIISKLDLKLLDISNNYFINKPMELMNIETLEILSMENCKFGIILDNIFKYSKLINLRELDISGNKIKIEELEEISKLKKLELLYCNNTYISFLTAEQLINIFVNNSIKIKSLEYLDISWNNIHILNDNISNDNISNDDYISREFLLLNIKKLVTFLPNLKKLKIVIGNKDEITRIMNDIEVTTNSIVFD